MAEHLVLVGMMGAGKSTVGRLVASSLGRTFVDVDEQIERSSGLSVPELFARRGESAFRQLEEQELARSLEGDADSVISVGGGAVLSATNRQRLTTSQTVVWLRARPDTLAARVGDGAGRPLLGASGTAARLAELDAERGPLYAAVASAVVDVDGMEAELVAERVVELAR